MLLFEVKFILVKFMYFFVVWCKEFFCLNLLISFVNFFLFIVVFLLKIFFFEMFWLKYKYNINFICGNVKRIKSYVYIVVELCFLINIIEIV